MKKGKKYSVPVLKNKLKEFKKQGKKVVFTNGCFDLFHPGHIRILEFARDKGDILVVGMNSDRSVRKIKGDSRPVLDEGARAEILGAIKYVDFVVMFDDPTPYNVIKELRPHFLVKGSDWSAEDVVGRDVVEKVYRVNLVKGYSTTKIIEKILHTCKK